MAIEKIIRKGIGRPTLLLEAAKPERRLFTRTSAVRALAKVALKDAALNTTLLNLLKEETPKLQEAVIRTLRDRKAKEAIPAIQPFATSASKDLQDVAKDALEELAKP